MSNFKQVSIVGGDSLIGKELREQLEERKYRVLVKELGSAEDEFTSILTIKDGEAAIQPKLDATALMESEIVFLAGTAESSEEAWDILSRLKPRPEIVDVTGFLPESAENVKTVVHSAASVLITLMSRIVRQQRVREAVITIFQPASELGRSALEELQQQTTSLLNLQSQNREVFDAQLAFTILPRYGAESAHSLKAIEDRIYHDIAASGVHPVPSIRLIQAPVFHGYSFSIWIQFEENPGAERLREILASAQVDVREDSTEPPTNTGVVGQPGVTVGLMEVDRNDPKACWLWAAADNFRVLVDDAIECVRPLLVGDEE
jgi:aspartate-semialdehyde dehydrogenase